MSEKNKRLLNKPLDYIRAKKHNKYLERRMETNLEKRLYMFYFEDEEGKECNEAISSETLDKAKKLFSDSFNNKIIKISEFPKAGEGSIPNVVYHKDCD